MHGTGVAFIAEVAISCALMLTVLFASSHKILSRYTPYFVGTLCDFYHARNAPFQNEYESRANLWKHFEAATGMPFGYIPGPDSGHVPCCRILFVGARRHRPILRQTPSRQGQALYFLRRQAADLTLKKPLRQQPPQPRGNWPPKRGSLSCSGLK